MGEVSIIHQSVDDNRNKPDAGRQGNHVTHAGTGCKAPPRAETGDRCQYGEGEADYTEAYPEIEDEVVRMCGEPLAPGDWIHIAWQVCVQELVVAVPPDRPIRDHPQC